MQKGLLELMRQLYGNAMLRTPLKDSAEIDNATARRMSVYEMDRPSTGKAVRDRCLTDLDGAFNEIELDIRRLWPSRSEEHTSELKSLMRISYAVYCLKKKSESKYAKQY